MANLIKRVVVASYQTTDGQTFSNKEDAQKYQAHLDRLSKIGALVKANMADAVTTPTDELAAEIALFIVQNADALREILPKRAKSVEVVPADPIPANELIDPATPMTGEQTAQPYNPVIESVAA
jgi:dsDNA-binding SOS-regulon protein